MSSRQDFEQVIQDVHDLPNHALQVNVVAGNVNALNPSVGPTGAPVPADGTLIAGKDGGSGNLVAVSVDSTGKINVNATLSGGATEATLSSFSSKSASAFVNNAFDYIAQTYVPSGNGTGQIQTVTYKLGGAGGSTINVLTLAYDSSDRLISVTKT